MQHRVARTYTGLIDELPRTGLPMSSAATPDPDAAVAIRANLQAVQARIDQACAQAGRDPAEVRLLPVSKTVDEARLRAAHAAGCRWLGENKVQEAQRKCQALSELPGLRWSIIGHLQTNKVRDVARFADEFQALDSLRVAEALERHLQAEGRGLDVFVQVNTSGETSKFGLVPDAVPVFVRDLRAYPALRLRGLMTLAVLSSDDAAVRACFRRLRQVRDAIADVTDARELSMGMSGDYPAAIAEGATVVRIGQAIFGARPTPG